MRTNYVELSGAMMFLQMAFQYIREMPHKEF